MKINIVLISSEIKADFKHINCEAVPRVGETVIIEEVEFAVKTVYYELEKETNMYVPTILLY